MVLLVFVVARLAPALLALSVALVAGRFLHDRWVGTSRAAARAVFAAVLVAACVALGPYAIRSGILLRAELALRRSAWSEADRLLTVYRDLAGLPSAPIRADWAKALLNLRQWSRAEDLLLTLVSSKGAGKVSAAPRTVLLLGLCRYHEGRLPEAEQAFLAVPDGPDRYRRDYFLGRLAEERSDRSGAMKAYRRSLAAWPRFLPSLYQAVRLSLDAGDVAGAGQLLAAYAKDAPEQAGDPRLAALRNAVQEGRTVAVEEFYFVED